MKTILKSFIIFGITSLVIAGTAMAQTTTHTVKKGETLFSIAKEYNVNVQQLKEWNNLQSNNLELGQSLVIKKNTPENAIQHTVEAQETLFSISKQYNVSIAEIKSWNNLSSNNLDIGQSLTIYPSEDTSKEQSIVVDKETQQNTYYTVKSGDSLYKIAQQHDMTVNELKELNDLSSNTIRIGQRLTVRGGNTPPPSVAESMESSPQGKYVVYTVPNNSTLQQLLNKFRMDEQEFRALNPSVNDNRLTSGQKVTMLAPPSRTYKNPYLTNNNLQNLGSTSVSEYGNSERATPTTNGELYNPDALTAAHSNISLGTVIFIENPENKKGVYVRINDRHSGNGLKLSKAAWQTLDFKSSMPTVTIYQDQ